MTIRFRESLEPVILTPPPSFIWYGWSNILNRETKNQIWFEVYKFLHKWNMQHLVIPEESHFYAGEGLGVEKFHIANRNIYCVRIVFYCSLYKFSYLLESFPRKWKTELRTNYWKLRVAGEHKKGDEQNWNKLQEISSRLREKMIWPRTNDVVTEFVKTKHQRKLEEKNSHAAPSPFLFICTLRVVG